MGRLCLLQLVVRNDSQLTGKKEFDQPDLLTGSSDSGPYRATERLGAHT